MDVLGKASRAARACARSWSWSSGDARTPTSPMRSLRVAEPGPSLRSAQRRQADTSAGQKPPLSPREGGVIKPGFNADLDELRQIATGGKEWIARFQADEIERTGINSLKVGFNRVFGYYIEITHTHAAKIPTGYQRKQTLKNAESSSQSGGDSSTAARLKLASPSVHTFV